MKRKITITFEAEDGTGLCEIGMSVNVGTIPEAMKNNPAGWLASAAFEAVNDVIKNGAKPTP